MRVIFSSSRLMASPLHYDVPTRTHMLQFGTHLYGRKAEFLYTQTPKSASKTITNVT